MSDQGVRLHSLRAEGPVHDSPPIPFKEPRPNDLESVSSEDSLSFAGGPDDRGILFGLSSDDDPPGFDLELYEILKLKNVLQLIVDCVGNRDHVHACRRVLHKRR